MTEINDEGDFDDIPKWVNKLAEQDGHLPSPIDINIAKTVELQAPSLQWFHMETTPKKMKITNTGYTLILSAKWFQERPYICRGPLMGNYVFSQLHFHWGKNDLEGSEHTIDGVRYPIEMHVVTFKSNYLTQESALKERDGIAVLVYMFKLQSGRNPVFQELVDNILAVQKPHSSAKLNPIPLGKIVRKFERDYFMYWGSVTTSVCVHYILWLISREPVGVSAEQVEELRSLLDANDEPLQGNFRNVEAIGNRQVFHVCPSSSKYSTLLSLP